MSTCHGLNGRRNTLVRFSRAAGSADFGGVLLCLPYAGAGAIAYADWPGLVAGLEVIGTRLPGRESRMSESPIESVEEMARSVVAEFGTLPARPVALYGHSLGGLIAFEAALQLERQGRPPVAVFVSGCRAPGIRPDEHISGLPDDDLVTECAKLGALSPGMVTKNRELINIMLPTLRADIRAAEDYYRSPGLSLSVPLIAFAGRDDASVSAEEIWAWQEHSSGALSFHLLPGGHFFIHHEGDRVRCLISSHFDLALARSVG
jgi:surfactin synthase thioesterase subunit